MSEERGRGGVYFANLLAAASLGFSVFIYFDTREQLEAAQPSLSISSSVLFAFDGDDRPDPDPEPDDRKPVIDARTFDTYDSIWLKVTIENTGGKETSIQNAELPLAGDYALGPGVPHSVWCKLNDAEIAHCPAYMREHLSIGDRLVVFFVLKDGGFRAADRVDGEHANKQLVVKVWAAGTTDQPREFTSGASIRK